MPQEPTAADVMTDGVIVIERDASVHEAAEKMRSEDIRSLVVVEEGGVVGIIVGRDVLYEVVAAGDDAGQVQVGDVMTEDLITASVNDNIEDIARAMIANDISRVPIMRGDDVVGIVSQSNIMAAWPSYVDLIREERHAFDSDEEVLGTGGLNEPETVEGKCDSCENYSEDLVASGNELLCSECRDSDLI